MTESMSKEQPIRAGFVVLVIVFALIIAVMAFANFNPGIKNTINSWLGLGPGTEEILKVSENFNKTLDNINNCSNLNDEDCICDIWPDFPIVFPKDYVLSIDELMGNLELIRDGKKLLGGTVEPGLGVYPVALDQGELFYGRDYYLEQNRFLFNKEFPEIQKKASGKIVSKYFLKDYIGDLFIFTYYWGVPTKEKISEIDSEIQKFPVCIERRTDAIDEFKRIRDSLTSATGEYTVRLPPEFLILINDQQMSLMYDDQLVKEIKYEKTEIIPGNLPDFVASLGLTPREEIHKFKIKEMKAPVQLCSNSKKEGSLKNNAVINIKQENTGSGTVNCLYF